MATKAVFKMQLTCDKDLDISGKFTQEPTVTHNIGEISSQYTSGGTPDHDTAWSVSGRAVSAGDIDLTALTDELGDALDLTTKFVHAIYIKCAAANSGLTTFQEHATNGYGIFGLGSSVILKAGASILLLANGGNEAVSATAKIIDVAGTAADTFDMVISAGD